MALTQSPTGLTPTGDNADPTPARVGIHATPAAATQLTGVRFKSPVADAGVEIGVYSFDVATPIARKTGFALVVGDNDLIFDTPVALTGGVDVAILVGKTGASTTFHYPAVAYGGGTVNGFTFPATSGVYDYSASGGPASSHVSGSNYGVSLLTGTVDPPTPPTPPGFKGTLQDNKQQFFAPYAGT